MFCANDGCRSSEPLKCVINNKILIAYKMNEATIPPERGYPLMLVAQDKWGY